MPTTQEQIIAIVAETLNIPLQDMTQDMTMEGTEEWDSLKHMELVAAIESKFYIQLDFEEIVNMVNIPGIQETVTTKLNENGPT